MSIFPYRSITISTDLDKPEAIRRFQKAVLAKVPPHYHVHGPRDFYAKIDGDRFTANRLLNDIRANSFVAILHGNFTSAPDGTELRVSIYPPVIVLVLLIVLAGLPLIEFFRELALWLAAGQAMEQTLLLLPIALLAYSGLVSAFIFEADRAERFLRGLYAPRAQDQRTSTPVQDGTPA